MGYSNESALGWLCTHADWGGEILVQGLNSTQPQRDCSARAVEMNGAGCNLENKDKQQGFPVVEMEEQEFLAPQFFGQVGQRSEC